MRAAGLWLALAAMVLRLAMPVGWMPGPALAKGIPIVLCTMDGPVKAVMPLDEAPKPSKSDHQDTCPFGAAPHFATVVPLVFPGAPLAKVAADNERPRAPVPLDRPYAIPSPRAPPKVV